MNQLPAAEVLPRGTMVGEYRVVARHATGGMGAVYEARHPLIGRRVAIKVILGRLSKNLTTVQRFVDEARAANRIGHPNIVDIFSFGALDDGRCYFVMEWLEGESLHDRMCRGYLGAGPTLEILLQLSDALAAAHEAGVIHRDLKPANVQLVKRGVGEQVKLLDFGIAKLSEHVEEGVTLGTPEYISPEQARGETVEIATDIYALGAMSYALFLGRLPFTAGDPRAVIDLQINEPVPPPESLWPRVPPALGRLLQAMLAKEASSRPSLDQVRAELERLNRARSLNETFSRTLAGRSKRPMLVRDFSDLAGLVQCLMNDLSGGVTWVMPTESPPPAGAPILIRFQVEDYGVAIDFPGIVEHHVFAPAAVEGAVRPRSLVRYDRIRPAELNRVVAVASGFAEEGGGETGACWAEPPADDGRWNQEVPPEWGKRVVTPDGRVAQPEPITEVLPSRRRDRVGGEATRSGADSLLDPAFTSSAGAPLLPGDPSAESRSGESEPDVGRSWFGLSLKVLALTVVVTVGAVLAVMVVANDHVQVDRAYYFEELSLRTSLYLAETSKARLAGWRAELRGVLAGDPGVAESFETLILCGSSGCEALRGRPPTFELSHNATAGVHLAATESSLLVSQSNGTRTAHGLMEKERVIDAASLPSYLSAWLLDRGGKVLVAVGPSRIPNSLMKPLEARSPPGSKPYVTEEGQEMIGAWSGAGELAVAVAVPKSVASRAVERLRTQVGYAALIVLAVAAVFALVFARQVTRRLRLLTVQTTRIGRGEFTAVAGAAAKDEVGQLARSFEHMTKALRERDEEVRDIQRRMSQAESKAVQRQLAESLETQLAGTLDSMRSLLEVDLDGADPGRDFRARRSRLRVLHQRAAAAVQRALALTTIAHRRIDLASAVSEAVEYTRRQLGDRAPVVHISAPNAVLFPRLDLRESELREIVMALLGGWVEGNGPDGTVDVILSHRQDQLMMRILYPAREEGKRVVSSALAEIEPLILDSSASTAVREQDGRVAVIVAFAVDLASEGGG